ncbi:hypothetical protein FRC12_005227 [Ceratobasidium sp. 428]|nr:hypothetical protein FRC12_005227 [Ceratobasidium sp. 428]
MSTSAAHSKVFETPELLGTICGFAERRTCATVLLLNQLSFRVAVPFAWNEVTRVTHLLKLIPGVNVPGVSHSATKITLPPFASADFSRFDMYAPYVRSLEVHSNTLASPWKTLLLRSKQRPLLQHLSSLTIWQEDHENPINKELMWMSVFLTQSLTSIRIRASSGTWIRPICGASVLLNIIVTSSPQVKYLTLPAISEGTEEADSEYCLLNLLPDRPVAESFRALSNLRLLTVSFWIFRNGSLQALGSLPRLKILRIFPGRFVVGTPEAVPFEENLFPALGYLQMEKMTWSDAKLALGHRFLVKNLVSLKLVLKHETGSLGDADDTFLMLKGMDRLVKLDINFENQHSYYVVESGGTFLSALSQLPLVTVSLSNTRLFNISELHLGQVFSSLVELRMPDQHVDMPEFQFFAAIPNLESLAVALGDSYTIVRVKIEDVTPCPSLITLELTNKKGDESDKLDPYYAKSIARYFFQLFPNMETIDLPQDTYESSTAHQFLSLLDVCMGLTRERSDARTAIAEQCGWDVANRLLPDETDFDL